MRDHMVRLGFDVNSRPVAKATKDVKDFGRAGKETAQSTSSSTSSITKNFRAVAVATGAITSAIAAFAATVRVLQDYEGQMAKVAAVSRATGEEMQNLRKIAADLGSSTEFTAKQAGEGLEFLARAGFTATESVAAIPAVLDLATAAAMDLGRAADVSSNIMSAFGIEAKKASSVADVLAAASARANTDVNQLGDAMAYVGPVASSLGVSMNDAAAAIGVLSDAGIQGGAAGTGLRRVLSTLANTTPAATKAIESLGLKVSELNPQTHSLTQIIDTLSKSGMDAARAMEIFGDRGGPAILALTSQTGRLQELTGELKNVSGESERMARIARDSLQGDFKGLASAIQGVAISLGDAGLTAVIRTAVQAMTGMVRTVSSIIELVSDNADYLIAALGILAATRLPAVIAGLSSMVGWLGSTQVVMWTTANAAGALSTALNMLPGVAIITGLAYAITGTIRAFRDTAAAAAHYDEALGNLEGTVGKLDRAQQRYYDNMTRGNLNAMVEQAKATRALMQSMVEAAQQKLDTATKVHNFLWLGIGESKAMKEAAASLREFQAELMDAETAVSAAENAMKNFETIFGSTSSHAEDLASSMRSVGGAVYETVPALKDLHEEYGSMAREIREVLIAQNELAVSDFQASIGHVVQDVEALAAGFRVVGQTTDEAMKMAQGYAGMITDAGTKENLAEQSSYLGIIADMLAKSAGGAANLSGEARVVYDALREGQMEAARLHTNLTNAEGSARGAASGTDALSSGLRQAVGLAAQLVAILGSIPAAMAGIAGQVDSAIAGLQRRNASLNYQVEQGLTASAALIKAQRDEAIQLAAEQGASVDRLAEIGKAFDEKAAKAEELALSIDSKNKALQESAKAAAGSVKATGGAGKAMKKATKDAEALADAVQKLEWDADPIAKYHHELAKLDYLMANSDLTQGAYQKAVQDLNDELANQIPMVNDVANAWAEWLMSGLTDFKSFAKSIWQSFRKLLVDMIAAAARNKILFSMGVGGGGIAGTAASAAGGLGGGGGGILGSLTGGGGIFGSGGLAGGATGIFGTSGIFGTMGANIAGTIGNMIGGVGSQLAASMAGIGATLGAAVPIIGGVVAAISFFKKSTKELDAGIRVTVRNMDAFVETFSKTETKRFWGLSKKTSTSYSPAGADTADPIQAIVSDMGASVLEMAQVFGASKDALDDFSASFQLSLKGLSDEAAQKKIEEALGEFSDKMVEEIFSTTTEQEIERAASALFGDMAEGVMRQMKGSYGEFIDREHSRWGKVFAEAGKEAETTTRTVKTLSDEFIAVQREGESATETLTRLYTSLLSANNAMEMLNFTLFEATLAGGDAASAFADAFGGLEEMGNAVSAYFQRFYTEAEQVEYMTNQVTNALAEMGLVLPATIEGFRALVDQAERMGDMERVAGLISLSGAFASMIDAQQQIRDAQQQIRDDETAKLEAAVRQAEKNLRDAFGREQEKTRAKFDAIIKDLRDKLTGARERMNSAKAIADALANALKSRLFPDVNAQRVSQDQAAAYLKSLVGKEITDIDAMQEALRIVANPSADTYKTLEEYRRDFHLTSGVIQQLETTAQIALTEAEKTVIALERQIEQAQMQFDLEMQILDDQLEALLGIDESVMSVEEAIGQLAAAVQALAAAQKAAAAVGGSGGSSHAVKEFSTDKFGATTSAAMVADASNSRAINKIYNEILGRDADKAGLEFYVKAAREDTSISQIRDYIAKSDEALTGVIPKYAAGGLHRGGLRIVGENGPELERTGPSHITSNSRTKQLFDNSELVAEMRAMRNELAEIRSASRSTARSTNTSARMVQKWDENGVPIDGGFEGEGGEVLGI